MFDADADAEAIAAARCEVQASATWPRCPIKHEVEMSPRHYSSPPCFGHELTEGEGGYATVDEQTRVDVARWRSAERARLLALRRSVPTDERHRLADKIATELDRMLRPAPGITISVYWPIRGEIDLRRWMTAAHQRGARIALPNVIERKQPLEFLTWSPGARMRTGIWKIPVPADAEPVIPDIVIAPLLGFDAQCYRLGNGGGYFDRTLPVLAPRWAAALREVGPGRLAPDTRLPRTGVIGVGHVCLEIPTIFPQPHDIAMDAVVTGTDWTRYKPHLFP